MKITKEMTELLLNGSREERAYACARSFKLFAICYFTKYFTHKPAPFHDDFYTDFEDLVYGRITQAAWVAYRDSAKSSIGGTMGCAWIVARKQVIDDLRKKGENVDHWGVREYVNIDCYDKANAENIIFDLVEELQSNELLIADYGQLYNEKRSKEEVTIKRISKFNTTNRIRFEAHTAMTPVRGRKFGNKRPDFILRDDLENAITVRSPVTTEKLIEVLDEGKGGKAQYASELTLGNYIIENGVVGYIMQSVEGAGGRVRFIPVVDKQGVLSWPDRHVKTDAEAVEANRAISDPTRRKISLESKKREMNAAGRRVYEVEMLLDPVAAGSPFFNRKKVEAAMEKATDPAEDIAGLFIWDKYNAAHLYGIGGDVGKGSGDDASTSVTFDYTPIPAQQVASYANNEIPADLFAYELKRHGNIFGQCLIGPEKNSEHGGSCLTTLKLIYPLDLIFQQVPLDKQHENPTGELGWETTGASKFMMLDEFRTAFESGHVVINDIRILKEMRTFTHTDADELGKNRIGHFTKHFDLLIAAAIGWQMRKHARAKPTASTYVQPAHETPGL
jgi:hypothetical protein